MEESNQFLWNPKPRRRNAAHYRALSKAMAEAPKNFNEGTATEQKAFIRAKTLIGDLDFRGLTFKKGTDLRDMNLSGANFKNAYMPGVKLGMANDANLNGVTWLKGSVDSLTNSTMNNAFVYGLQASNLAARNLSIDGTLSIMNNFSGIQGQNMSRRGGFSFGDNFNNGNLEGSTHSCFAAWNSMNGVNARGASITGYMAHSSAVNMDISNGRFETRGHENDLAGMNADGAIIGRDVAVDAERTEATLKNAKFIDHEAVATRVEARALHDVAPGRYEMLKAMGVMATELTAAPPAQRAAARKLMTLAA